VNLEEFRQFKQLEAVHAPWQCGTEECSVTVQLPDQLPIKVHAVSSPLAGKYSYVLSRFGVVKLLNDSGTVVDKSPLCHQLDAAVRRHYEQMEYMRGAKHRVT